MASDRNRTWAKGKCITHPLTPALKPTEKSEVELPLEATGTQASGTFRMPSSVLVPPSTQLQRAQDSYR